MNYASHNVCLPSDCFKKRTACLIQIKCWQNPLFEVGANWFFWWTWVPIVPSIVDQQKKFRDVAKWCDYHSMFTLLINIWQLLSFFSFRDAETRSFGFRKYDFCFLIHLFWRKRRSYRNKLAYEGRERKKHYISISFGQHFVVILASILIKSGSNRGGFYGNLTKCGWILINSTSGGVHSLWASILVVCRDWIILTNESIINARAPRGAKSELGKKRNGQTEPIFFFPFFVMNLQPRRSLRSVNSTRNWHACR